MKRLWTLFFISILLLSLVRGVVVAQSSLQDDIKQYEQKIAELQQQKNTLAKQISLFDSQISLTSLRINTIRAAITKLTAEVDELAGEIERLEGLLTKRTELVLRRIPESYKRKSTSQVGMLFLSNSFSDFVARVKYISTIQEHDAALLFQLKATQNNFAERKNLREEKKLEQEKLKKQLEQESAALARQKREKEALLSQTKNNEATYQQLLAQAQAQLASLASFVDTQGASLLSNQTFCNDWGCYYNQRDSQWGNILINGQGSGCSGPCNMLRVGCLATSVAMMASHLGRRDISPSDVALSGPENFAVGTALLVRGSISVKGVNIRRTSLSGLTPEAVKDGPVIVGLKHGVFGTHFIVVKSFTNGNYIINDPYEAGGHDIPFTNSYSLGSIFEVDRVSM